MSSEVMTVTGPVKAEELGVVLPHEHLLVDLGCYWSEPTDPILRAFADEPVTIENLYLIRRHWIINKEDSRLDDPVLAGKELSKYKDLGGKTLVDVTPPDLGRDPTALREIAAATGLNIVMGCGHYVALAHPASVSASSVEQLEAEILGELGEGVGDTGIRPGIIGEIGTSNPLHEDEVKVLRAAGRAREASGTALSIHLHPGGRLGHEVLDILAAEGVDLRRVILGHLDITLGLIDVEFDEALAYHASLAQRGCYLEFDTVGYIDAYMQGWEGFPPLWFPSDRERARAISKLLDIGYGQQLLLSHDVCSKHHLTRYGGHGYGHILRNFTVNLIDFGVSEEAQDMLMIANPRRALSGES
jgi:phosphotriesterase-related protein